MKPQTLHQVKPAAAVLCQDCDTISNTPHPYCPACGSQSLLQLARVLNREEEPERPSTVAPWSAWRRARLLRVLGMGILAALCCAIPGRAQVDAPKPQPFLAGALNRSLAGAELGLRMGDAWTTFQTRPANCRGCREVVLPQSWANSLPAMTVYSVTAAAAVTMASEMLWRHGHHRMARWMLVADVLDEAIAVGHNVAVYENAPAAPASSFAVHPRGGRQ
jgi:hypothetical protein